MPGRPEQREEPTGAVRDRILVVAPETLALAVSPDERRLEPPRERSRRRSDHLEEPKRLDRLGFPLQRKRLDRLDLHGVPHEQPRLGADKRLRRGRRLLEARSDVDGVAGDERLTLAADDDLARVDPDPRLEAVLRDRSTHLRRCTHRAERVVLVRHRDPENRHDRIADELLDRATMTLDDRAQILEIAAHTRPERFRIGRLAERRRPHKIAEEDGDDLALLARVHLSPAKSGAAQALQNLASSGFSRPSSDMEPWAESRVASTRERAVPRVCPATRTTLGRMIGRDMVGARPRSERPRPFPRAREAVRTRPEVSTPTRASMVMGMVVGLVSNAYHLSSPARTRARAKPRSPTVPHPLASPVPNAHQLPIARTRDSGSVGGAHPRRSDGRDGGLVGQPSAQSGLLDRIRHATGALAATAGVEGASAAGCERGQGREREALEPARREGGLHLVLELACEESEIEWLRDA